MAAKGRRRPSTRAFAWDAASLEPVRVRQREGGTTSSKVWRRPRKQAAGLESADNKLRTFARLRPMSLERRMKGGWGSPPAGRKHHQLPRRLCRQRDAVLAVLLLHDGDRRSPCQHFEQRRHVPRWHSPQLPECAAISGLASISTRCRCSSLSESRITLAPSEEALCRQSRLGTRRRLLAPTRSANAARAAVARAGRGRAPARQRSPPR